MGKIQNFFSDNRKTLLIFLCVLVVYGLSYYRRQSTYWFWMDNPQEYVAENVTAMSGNDSYFWLRMARELDAGHLGKKMPDPTKGYPDLTPLAINDTPSLLAELISFGKNFTGGNYYQSGLLLIPILSGLFIFPLFFYFNRLGFGASAVLGGLIGSFSHSYYDRTMMGRVDTDLLNTFFPLAAACFILPMNREKSWLANVGLSAGAGLMMFLFTWWYQQPSIILVYLFFLALHLLFGRVGWKQAVLILLVFLLAAGPKYILQSVESLRIFLWTYVSPPPTGKIAWPNVMQVITEAKHRSLEETLKLIHGYLPLVFAGFAGLAYLYVRRFRGMIPITPLVILGAWSLTGPIRFAMYLAPLVGVGAGVLIETAVRLAADKARVPRLVVPLAAASIMFILFFSTSGYTGYPFNIAPTLNAPTTRALLDIKKIVPRHSAMFTPYWEYSYALMDIGDFATYHDGGTQGGIRTTLAAKAMVSHQQEEMVSLLAYLEDFGFNHLSRQLSRESIPPDKMLDMVFNYPEDFKGKDVYVLYLENMIWKFPPMSFLGTWDFEAKKSDPMDYVELHCFSLSNDVMTCRDGKIDLGRGFMNDGKVDIPLSGAFFVNDGYVVDRKLYDHPGGYYLQVLMKNGKADKILVADERLFRTNFNQQFLLGNFDRRYFEEVYNNFPVARVLRVKRPDGSDLAR